MDGFCGDRLDGTVYGLLHREWDRLFPDEMFADLFTTRGRRSTPPSVVACDRWLSKVRGAWCEQGRWSRREDLRAPS